MLDLFACRLAFPAHSSSVKAKYRDPFVSLPERARLLYAEPSRDVLPPLSQSYRLAFVSGGVCPLVAVDSQDCESAGSRCRFRNVDTRPKSRVTTTAHKCAASLRTHPTTFQPEQVALGGSRLPHDSKRDVVVKVAGVFSLRRCSFRCWRSWPVSSASGRHHRRASRASACRWRRSR